MQSISFSTIFTTILISQLIIIGLLLNLHNLVKYIFKSERKLENTMALDFGKLQTAVENDTTVEQSAVRLITQIAGEIAANAGDQQKVSDLADKLNQSADALAAAITANTPAASTVTTTTTTTSVNDATGTSSTATDTSNTGQ